MFDVLVVPGADHGAGPRGPSAPYSDRKLADFFLHNLLGVKSPDWNAAPVPARSTGGGDSVGFLDRVTGWDAIRSAWHDAEGIVTPAALASRATAWP